MALEKVSGGFREGVKMFSNDNLLHLCQSVPRWLSVVIGAKGGHTKW
jgi:hypothetical protein